MKAILTRKFRIASLFWGYFLLNLILAPFTILITLFVGIMAGGSPNAPGALESFATVAAYLYLAPLGVFLAHIVLGKIFDTVCLIVKPLAMEISWFGIGVTAIVLVILGNVFVDNLYQFRQGDFTLSFMALGADLFGMLLIIACSAIPIPFLKRRTSEHSATV